MDFVFKIGPLDTEDGPLKVYFVDSEEGDVEPVLAESDAEGLGELVAARPGAEWACEPDLAAAGEPLGFTVVELDEERAHRIGLVTFDLVLGEQLEEIEYEGTLYHYGNAAAAFWRAEPWRHDWTRRQLTIELEGLVEGRWEGCVMGADGIEYGVALYPGEGDLQRVEELAHSGDLEAAARVESLAVTFEDDPPFAADAMRRAYGLERMPEPTRVFEEERVYPDENELMVLAAVLRAVAELGPDGGTAVGEAEVETLRQRARVVTS